MKFRGRMEGSFRGETETGNEAVIGVLEAKRGVIGTEAIKRANAI